MGMGVDLSILYFWRQYALVFARMFLGMPECWLSYSRAEQYPGSCSRSSEGRPRLLHTSSPWREGFPKFPVTAAVHQEGWWGQLAAWKPDCKKALPSPQMPISSEAKHFHNSLLLRRAVWPTANRYELLWLRKWCSNKSRQKSFTVSSVQH